MKFDEANYLPVLVSLTKWHLIELDVRQLCDFLFHAMSRPGCAQSSQPLSRIVFQQFISFSQLRWSYRSSMFHDRLVDKHQPTRHGTAIRFAERGLGLNFNLS